MHRAQLCRQLDDLVVTPGRVRPSPSAVIRTAPGSSAVSSSFQSHVSALCKGVSSPSNQRGSRPSISLSAQGNHGWEIHLSSAYWMSIPRWTARREDRLKRKQQRCIGASKTHTPSWTRFTYCRHHQRQGTGCPGPSPSSSPLPSSRAKKRLSPGSSALPFHILFPAIPSFFPKCS